MLRPRARTRANRAAGRRTLLQERSNPDSSGLGRGSKDIGVTGEVASTRSSRELEAPAHQPAAGTRGLFNWRENLCD